LKIDALLIIKLLYQRDDFFNRGACRAPIASALFCEVHHCLFDLMIADNQALSVIQSAITALRRSGLLGSRR
jgi:hypothetical protein